ncbi:hypothetical protein GO303_04947 [Ralstonia solanacearum]|nr:hypothetical protein [Ralstonia solanacearum]
MRLHRAVAAHPAGRDRHAAGAVEVAPGVGQRPCRLGADRAGRLDRTLRVVDGRCGDLRALVRADRAGGVVEGRGGGQRHISAFHTGAGRVGVLVEDTRAVDQQRAARMHQTGAVVERRAADRDVRVGGDLAAGIGDGVVVDRQGAVGDELALRVVQRLALYVQRGGRRNRALPVGERAAVDRHGVADQRTVRVRQGLAASGERGAGLQHAVGVRDGAGGCIERRRSRDGATDVVHRAGAGVDRDVAPGHGAGLVAQARGRQRNVLRGEQLAACVGDRAGAGDRQVAAAGAEHAADRVVEAGDGGVEVAGSGDRAALVDQIAGLDRGRARCGNGAAGVVERARTGVDTQTACRDSAALVVEAGGIEGCVLRGDQLATRIDDIARAVQMQAGRLRAEHARSVVQAADLERHVTHGGQRAATVDHCPRTDGSRTGDGHRAAGVVEQTTPRVQRQVARREGAALVSQARAGERRILRSNQLAASVIDGAGAGHVQAGRLRAERAAGVVQPAEVGLYICRRNQRAPLVDQAARIDRRRAGCGYRALGIVDGAGSGVQRQVARRDRAGLVAQARCVEGGILRGHQLAARVFDGASTGHAQAARLRAERAPGVVQTADVGSHIPHRSQRAALVDQAARIDRRSACRGHRALGVVDRAAARIQQQVARRHHPALAVQAGGRDRSILRGDQLAARIDDIASAVQLQAGRLRAERTRGVIQAADLQRHVTNGGQRAAPVDQRAGADGSRTGGGHRAAGVIDPAGPRVD